MSKKESFENIRVHFGTVGLNKHILQFSTKEHGAFTAVAMAELSDVMIASATYTAVQALYSLSGIEASDEAIENTASQMVETILHNLERTPSNQVH